MLTSIILSIIQMTYQLFNTIRKFAFLIDHGIRSPNVIFAPETKFHSSLGVKFKVLPPLLKSEVSRAKVKHPKKKQWKKDMTVVWAMVPN